jgi:hypothetical protein
VDHDLIAAGHPRLNFEFAAFLANMPPHWFEDTRGNFPARAWAVGQVASSRAAVAQLHDRAARARAAKGNAAAASPWPEFSEYDCFSCHHDLADEAWRKQGDGSGLTTGTPPWGTWYYPLTLALAGTDPHAESDKLAAHFATLRKEMDGFAPDPAKVGAETRALAGLLDRWLQALPEESRAIDPPRIKGLIDAVEKGKAGGWDAAAQRYLALQPLRLALKGLDSSWDDTTLRAELERSFSLLQFPRGFDSPRRFDPASLRGNRPSE